MKRHYKYRMMPALFALAMLCIFSVPAKLFAQDSTRYTRLPFKNSAAKVLKLKETKAVNLPAYKYSPQPAGGHTISKPAGKEATRPVTIVSALPNPVESVLKLMIHADKACVSTIKIVDILGNDVLTFGYERLLPGENGKTYNIPQKLNPGIYFVKVITGADAAMKRISVL